ncbi:PepSY-like domain-containing protein [Bacteroidota bacterium]
MRMYLVIFFIIFFATECFSQTKTQRLKEIYPAAKKEKWSKDRNGNSEAHFKMNGSKYRADFTPSGEWIETERSIKWDDLPPAVRHTIKKYADKDQVVELEEVHHHKKGWFYDVEIKKKKKGKRDLVIGIDGIIIDKEEWK